MPKGVYQRPSLKERFLSQRRVDVSGCWEWIGAKFNHGYGSIRAEGRSQHAHRVSFTLFRGQIPVGQYVLHRCDNKACVNPDHLFLGDAADNARDAVQKRRHAFGVRHGLAVLSDEIVSMVRASDLPNRVLAAELGVDHSTISAVRRRRNWRHVA